MATVPREKRRNTFGCHIVMEEHIQALRQLCRLCGKATAIPNDRSPCEKGKYAKTLDKCLNVNVTDEDSDVFPPYICKACDLKLHRYKVKTSKKKTLNIVPVSFEPHGEACHICPHRSYAYDDMMRDCTAAHVSHHMLTSTMEDRTLFFYVEQNQSNVTTIPKCITIFADHTWNVSIHGRNTKIRDVPVILNGKADVQKLFCTVAESFICCGNKEFVEFVADKNLRTCFIDDANVPTVRHNKCDMLVQAEGDMCNRCQLHTVDLRSHRRKSEKSKSLRTASSSKTQLKHLTKRELILRAKSLQAEKRRTRKLTKNLRERVRKAFHAEKVELTENQAELLKGSMEELDAAVKEKGNKLQKLLWEQQKNMLKLKDKRSMKWHPAIIRLSIAVMSKSASAYNTLRDCGMIALPHPTTLKRYTQYSAPKVGIQYNVLETMLRDITDGEEFKKNVSLVVDEMKIKAGIVYSSSTGQFFGFTDTGDLSSELESQGKRLQKELDGEKDVASHACTVMVRGLFSSICQPVAFFPTNSLTHNQLYDMIWRVVCTVEARGLKVRAIVADGAHSNRKFFRQCSEKNAQDIPFYSPHPLDPDRKIYFICDVPHLMKTTRNNLENSGFNNKTRNLRYQGYDIRWTHLLEVYDWDVHGHQHTGGLCMLHKLTYEHLHLTPSLRMRVKLATQVLSQSVANAMKYMGKPEMKGTIEFIEKFNRFFDMMNVSNLNEGRRSRNKDLYPYESTDDWRFKWLEDFIGYIEKWEQEAATTPNLTPKERERRCLSRETREGLKIMVSSFVALTKELLAEDGVKFFLSEKLSQDPLEEYFSKQRGVGGSSDNPTALQFAHNIMTIQVGGSSVRAAMSANVKNVQRVEDTDLGRPLPKRKKTDKV